MRMNYSAILSYVTAGFELTVVFYFMFSLERKNSATVALLGLLIFLAGYQLLEALNCSPAVAGALSRAAFIDITWLPPLGLVYLALFMRTHLSRILAAIYLTVGLLFSLFYAFVDTSVILSHCDTVIAFYTASDPGRRLYGLFYQSGIALLFLVPFFFPGYRSGGEKIRELKLFQAGVLGFMVPSLVTAIFSLLMRKALPSMMCHYALILSVFLFIILLKREKKVEAQR